MTAPRLQTEIPALRGVPVNHGHTGPHVTYQPRRLSNARMGGALMSTEPAHTGHDHAVHCTLFAVDIVAFGDLRRDDEVQRYVRKAMYRTMQNAFDRSEVGWQPWFRQDRGDGVLMVVPSTVPTMLFLDPLIDLVRAGLRFHNKMSSDLAQIRLRVALHTGSVFFDGHGVVGHSLTRLFNLLEAPVFKTEFNTTAAEVGLVTSEHVYDDVIRHCSGLVDPGDYHAIEVVEDGFVTRGYVHIPPGPAGHAPSLLRRRRAAHATANGTSAVPDVRDVREARDRDVREGREPWEAHEVSRAAQ
jgi:hypothetical protein